MRADRLDEVALTRVRSHLGLRFPGVPSELVEAAVRVAWASAARGGGIDPEAVEHAAAARLASFVDTGLG